MDNRSTRPHRVDRLFSLESKRNGSHRINANDDRPTNLIGERILFAAIVLPLSTPIPNSYMCVESKVNIKQTRPLNRNAIRSIRCCFHQKSKHGLYKEVITTSNRNTYWVGLNLPRPPEEPLPCHYTGQFFFFIPL
jgi:hypothetical protein